MSAAPVLNPATVQELVDSLDAEFAVQLIDTFLTDSPDLVSDIHDGLRDGDVERVRRAAHTLKSHSWTFGLEQLAPLCQDLENLAAAGRLTDADPLAHRVDIAYPPARDALEAARADLSRGLPSA
ncbi:Hpt domain-containing protein [Streptomyces sp. WAC06614]|uniref:Hpt domain-containing protein n=1 Tax=Streptomyces sp. WAC06614 TaxID=2487416 RepID=UPI000F76CDB3|nr:Hpt domain-containing protein [Streptomyces sp. WAC06614]RSS83582.1 Hpt domain-containing protein [Streptomyces sp. WAC06614]